MTNEINQETLDRGHQLPRVRPRLALLVFAAVSLMVGLVLLAVWLVQRTLYGGDLNPPLPVAELADTIPPPRLQASPARDLALLEARTDIILNGYGWIDEEQGIVRIPVERAMELLLARGLEHPFEPSGGAAEDAEPAPRDGNTQAAPSAVPEIPTEGASAGNGSLGEEPPARMTADQNQQGATERTVGAGASLLRQSDQKGAKSHAQQDPLPADRPDLPVREGPAGLLPGVSPEETGALQPQEKTPPVDPEAPPSLLGPYPDPGAEAPPP